MTLGERCDEIVRLIDETLSDCSPLTATARKLTATPKKGVRPVSGLVVPSERGEAGGGEVLPRSA